MADEKSELMVLENTNYSVREFQPGAWAGILGDGMGFLIPSAVDLIPAWGLPQCDWMLRVMFYAQHNALFGGAHNVWIEKVLSTPFEISGGRNLTFKWQDIFFASDFGEGYDFMMQKALSDYICLNRGMFLELVSYGDPDTPLRKGAEIIGVNHLDAMRISYTGNLEYPFLYHSEYTGKINRLHRTRVINLTHSPSPNTRMYGMGKSHLYDALTVANAQILLGRHQNELLADQPPPGLVIFNNVNADQVETIMSQFEADRRRDGQNVYRGALRINSLDPTKPATVQFVPLASVPEGFNYSEYMQQHVNLLALVMGLDPQDIWPLSGQALGTGTQSRILSQKTQVKGPGYMLTRLERVFNAMLPRQLEFKFKAQNSEQDMETAAIAKAWTDVIQSSSFMSEEEKRQLAANQIPAFADVLLDEQGNVRLPEDDPKEQGQEVIATDNVEMDSADSNQNDVTVQDNTEATGEADTTIEPKAKAGKPSVAPKKPSQQEMDSAKGKANVQLFTDVEQRLKAGLITIDQAQKALGLPVDPSMAGLYIIDGSPTPKQVIKDLWQAHYGRGVASFESVVSGETMPASNGTGTVPEYAVKQIAQRKAIDDTESAFTDEMQAAMQDGVDRVVNKASTAARIRGIISRYGKNAYIDGLEDGGVDGSELDEDDLRLIADYNVWDSTYVTDLVNEIYSEAGMSETPAVRAPKWVSTLNRYYYGGIASADKNGMYEFTGDDGKENCSTCASLKGVKHRMKWWVDHELRPGLDHHNFECGTWPGGCNHYLKKVA